jgi:hypothetical protein
MTEVWGHSARASMFGEPSEDDGWIDFVDAEKLRRFLVKGGRPLR